MKLIKIIGINKDIIKVYNNKNIEYLGKNLINIILKVNYNIR